MSACRLASTHIQINKCVLPNNSIELPFIDQIRCSLALQQLPKKKIKKQKQKRKDGKCKCVNVLRKRSEKSCETESLICGASHQKTPSVRSTRSEANFVNGIHYSVSHNALHIALMTQTTALPTAHGLHTSTSLTWFQLL